MTASPTPPPAGRPDWAALIREIHVTDPAEPGVCQLCGAADGGYPCMTLDYLADGEDALAAAERRVAELQESRTTYANQVAIATEAREREHAEKVKTLQDQREYLEHREHVMEGLVESAESSSAAAARENERRTQENGRLKAAILSLTQFLHHVPGCDSIGSLPAPDCPCGLRARVNAALALAAEPRDTSHLIPIPGKPGGFTNRDYPWPSAETLEPDGEKNDDR